MAEPPIGREFTITRVFDVPRELVWKAWTDPEQVARWFGPLWILHAAVDRHHGRSPGGTFEFTMVSDDDGNEIPVGEPSSRSRSPSGWSAGPRTSIDRHDHVGGFAGGPNAATWPARPAAPRRTTAGRPASDKLAESLAR